jgi:hypothetical protein
MKINPSIQLQYLIDYVTGGAWLEEGSPCVVRSTDYIQQALCSRIRVLFSLYL